MKVVVYTILSVVGVLVALILYASSETGSGEERMEVPVVSRSVADTPGAAESQLRFITWNIGYGRGDAGDYSGPWTRELVISNLDGIAQGIRDQRADIALLQEVDLGAARTHFIDQAEYVAEKLGWGYVASVETWTDRYVPFPYWPPARHYGRMKSGQSVISKYPIVANRRIRLEQPADNPFWYNWFYLHRALQRVEIEVAKGRSLTVYNVHLEAFNVENNRSHVLRLLEEMKTDQGSAQVVGGDFNALPPETEKRNGYEDEPDIDFTGGNTMELFFEGTGYVDAVANAHDSAAFTHPTNPPTRRLDYLAVDPAVGTWRDGAVPADLAPLSDHMAVVGTLQFTQKGE